MNQLTLGGTVDMPRNSYPETFEAFWDLYPARSGGNPKRAAFKAWNARIREGVDPQQMVKGAADYAAYCEAMEQDGTPYVMQAATFLGPDYRFLEDYTPPPAKKPKTNDEWLALANEKGIQARVGESMTEFKKRVNAEVFGK
jgi:hypothetical protein